MKDAGLAMLGVAAVAWIVWTILTAPLPSPVEPSEPEIVVHGCPPDPLLADLIEEMHEHNLAHWTEEIP